MDCVHEGRAHPTAAGRAGRDPSVLGPTTWGRSPQRASPRARSCTPSMPGESRRSPSTSEALGLLEPSRATAAITSGRLGGQPELATPDLAAGRLGQPGDELDQPRVLVRRGARLDEVLQLSLI